MTGTAVKNASAILANVAPNAGKSAKSTAASGNFDFQSVWSNQMGKSAQNAVNTQKPTPDSKKQEQPVANQDNARAEEPQETVGNLKAPGDNRQPAKTDKVSQEQSGQTDELSPEELEAAMEALGAASAELMQKIADTFGISMEELQAAMEELGLEPLDLLQSAGMGELVLKLGGESDSLALITDETLCANYKALMERMKELLNETAENLELDPKQLEAALNTGAASADEKTVSEDKVSAEAVPGDKVFVGTASEEAVSGLKASDEKASGRPDETGLQADGTTKASDSLSEDRFQVEVNKPDGAADRRSGEKQSGKEADGGQQGNLFAQEFKSLQPETGLQQTQGVAQSASWNADTQDIMRQIMDYMKLQLNADTTNLELHLHPQSLGTLHIQVEAKAGVITASFITQNEAVKAALESQIVQLKESFEEQGVKVEAIEVTVQSHAFERNLDQGRGQNQGNNEPSRKARVRRINLNDLSSMEDMEEEDALAADMLAAGGSTVDYTA